MLDATFNTAKANKESRAAIAAFVETIPEGTMNGAELMAFSKNVNGLLANTTVDNTTSAAIVTAIGNFRDAVNTALGTRTTALENAFETLADPES